MQRKPGFPVANCSIKMPDTSMPEVPDDEADAQQRRLQLINFGHAQWGFNNWNWHVTKQELDFVDITGGKYTAGVAAFVSVTVKSFDIHRENVGYATTVAATKGMAIHGARKCAVTNALRETLLSFGGAIATDLLEALESHKSEVTPAAPAPDPSSENNPSLANKLPEPRNSPLNTKMRKDSTESLLRVPLPGVKNSAAATPAPPPPPVAKAHPMPVNLPPAANRAAPANAPRPCAPPAHPAPHAPPAPLAPPAPHAPHAPHAPPAPPHAHAPHAHAPHVRPNSNEAAAEGEDARAERKRRQRLAQEEFRLRQMQKLKELDKKQELDNNSTSVDDLLMAIPTQDIIIEETGNSTEEAGKRKSPAADCGDAKRRGNVLRRLDIVQD